MNNPKMLQAMYEEATIGIVIVNPSGEIMELNPYTEKLFGYSRNELLNQKIEMLLPGSFRQAHVHHRNKYHQNPVPRSMGANLDLFGQKKDGTQFPIEISLSHINLDSKHYAIAYISDNTLQKSILKELLERKEQLEATQKLSEDVSKIVEESLNEIFIFKAEKLNFIQVNKGARQNLGYSLSEMQAKTPVDIKPNFSENEFLELLIPLKNGNTDFLLFETIHERKDGTTYPVEVHLQYSKMGTIPVFVAFILDISERKKHEEDIKEYSLGLEQKVIDRTKKLKESEIKLTASLEKERELGELKSRFVSMASHEFRTPLSSILSSANLIGRYEKEDQQNKRMKHVNRIESSVRNLTVILNDFLSLEKLESGKVRYQSVELDFVDYIQHVVDEVNLIAKANQKITHQHSGSNKINTDEHLLKNILINLLSNGIKYSQEGKNVELHTQNENSILKIQVKDYGIGIPKEEQQHMFTRFFRANNVETIQGTGLGLTIVKRYLDLMSGKIWFESKEGEGTTFFVEIPLGKN